KPKFRQAGPVAVPKRQWVTIKAHLVFYEVNGTIELWQDGVRVLAATGATLPLPFAIQTNVEVGVSATDRASVLYLDDVRLSSKPF
ncbi:MAG: hypothetical protein ABI647_17605, partial [Gemmatimonadota bacterium]